MYWQVSILMVAIILAYQDWQKRSVSLWIFVLFALLCGGYWWKQLPMAAYGLESALNIVFLTVQFVLVGVIMYLRKTTFSWSQSIGTGDVLYILLLAFCWSTTHFLTIYLSGLVLGLLLAGYWQWKDRKQKTPIPLLTTLGFAFVVVMVYNWFM